MRKTISSILITVIMLANFLAPISVGWGNKKIEVNKNKVEAVDGGILLNIKESYTDKTIELEITASFEKTSIATEQGIRAILSDPYNENPQTPKEKIVEIESHEIINGQATKSIYFNDFDLTFDHEYNITIESRQNLNGSSIFNNLDLWSEEFSEKILEESQETLFEVTKTIQVTTSPKGQTEVVTGNNTVASNQNWEDLPSCNPLRGKGFIGCIAQGIYYVLFIPSSFLFAVSGTFFDWTFNYSVQSSSYKSQFVVQGWNIVRDFCNMFFIFVLLYIAFGTILNLHNVKTKEMIINVVIIGLLINFSLFATRVIIDTSNILARVFYNSNTIKITSVNKDFNVPNMIKKPEETGIIPLSAALVNKVNPQALIINARELGNIGGISSDTEKSGVTTGTFIIITLLASGISLVGFIVFLSVGLIFVARVVGLWIAMILAPFAFFSYTVPAMHDLEMVGWKKWWPETLKLAFLAPVFIFFIYLILQFLEIGLGTLDAEGKGSLGYILSIVMPFAFIMVLLWKAKDIAKKMSGSMGQSITNGIAKVGGLALGAGLGGAAMLGRNTFGRAFNKIGNNDWVNDSASGKNGKFNQFIGKNLKSISSAGSKSSFDIRQTKAGSVLSKETGMNLNFGTNYLGLDTKKSAGGYVAQQQRKIEKENKFGESLGYNHHKYEEVGEEISGMQTELDEYKASGVDLNNKEIKTEIQKRENKIAGKKKEQERIKTGRQKEYSLTNKRKSGKIYDIEKSDKHFFEAKMAAEEDPSNEMKQNAFKDAQIYRDANGNIKKFGHAHDNMARGYAQAFREISKGATTGAISGGIVGSIIPGIGTATGVISGGIAGGIRSAMHYSGTTNRKVGDDHFHKEDFRDKYVAPSSKDDHGASADHSAHKSDAGGHEHKH